MAVVSPTLTCRTAFDSASRSTTVVVVGEIDLANVAAFTAALDLVVERSSDPIVVDLTRAQHLGSCGMRPIFDAAHATRRQGRSLFVVLPTDPIARRVIDITRLGDVVPLFETRAAATAAVEATAPLREGRWSRVLDWPLMTNCLEQERRS